MTAGNAGNRPVSDSRLARFLEKSFSAVGCRSIGDFVMACSFVGLFLLTIAFFNVVDVFDDHYFEPGYSAVYNAFRIVFVGYYFWLLYAVGFCSLTFLASRQLIGTLPIHERLAFGFFIGAAVTTVVMLVLGYLYLYWRIVAALLAVAFIAASYRLFADTLAEGRSAIRDRFAAGSPLDRALWIVLLAVVIVAGAACLLVKGLYPQGGNDYYNHYSQFYSAVVDSHSIWPGRFWYHYYLSKGMGVTFLGMLLTDPLAPSLVAYCFAVATALLLFSLVGSFTTRTLWPWLAVILYFALNVHSLGTGIFSAHGGWGHFQKPHEVNGPMLLAIVWMSVNMVRTEGAMRRTWLLGAVGCAFVIGQILIVSPAIVGLFAVVAGVVFVFFRRDLSLAFGGIAVAAGAGLVCVLLLNYLTTGAPADVGAELWWPIVDLRKLASMGMLYDYQWIAHVRGNHTVNRTLLPEGFDFAIFVANLTRFDVLRVLVIWSAIAAAVAAISWAVLRRAAPHRAMPLAAPALRALVVLLAFVASMAVFTVAVGMTELVSYVRMTSFMLPLVIVLSAIVWQLGIAAIQWPRYTRWLPAVAAPLVMTYVSLAYAYDLQKPTLNQVVANAVRFVDGRYSIYDAYRDQSGWPALPNSTAIYPGIYEAWKSIGPGKRIWSFNVYSYCMLPGCHVEILYSSSMSKERDAIMFGTPEQARAALQRDSLNYFFISPALLIREVFHCAPLFAANTLRDNFDIQWTDGTDALLTWRGQGTARLSPEWVEKYRKAIEEGPYQEKCAPTLPHFMRQGHRLTDEVAKGKRWGAEVARP